ncbi:MAG: hypothetical protein II851_02770 [Bacteroidales bacterium]|nr:hypothetical protein [Bacteroidales bacterium]
MLTLDRAYSNFERLMETDRIWLDPDVDFSCICRILDVPLRRFDRFLYGELGFRGEEILAIYRRTGDKKA